MLVYLVIHDFGYGEWSIETMTNDREKAIAIQSQPLPEYSGYVVVVEVWNLETGKMVEVIGNYKN